MVKFYDTYSTETFAKIISSLQLPLIVQSGIAQLEPSTKSSSNEIVQLEIAQLGKSEKPMPKLLSIISFTSHIEIMNRCRSDEERIFYMLYARHQGLKTEELRRCIINQTFSSLMDKEKMLSPKLLADYPQSEFMLKDKARDDIGTVISEKTTKNGNNQKCNYLKISYCCLEKRDILIPSFSRCYVCASSYLGLSVASIFTRTSRASLARLSGLLIVPEKH